MVNPAETTYIGLDLAWSERHPTGAAALRGQPAGAALLHPPVLLGKLEAIIDYIGDLAGDGPAIVAVDAPLRVPNATGRRPAEAALARVFQRYEAGAHPANRRLLDRGPEGLRGEALVARLAAYGFRAAAHVEPGAVARLVVEVYPHAAMVALFQLTKTLKYKARGRQRGRAERLAAWTLYQRYLRELASADPPLAGHAALLDVDVTSLHGVALKGYEDRIDALLCAYIALYAHRWGPERCTTFGDLDSGWILTPTPA